MPSNTKVVPFTVKSNDCVLEVVESRPKKTQCDCSCNKICRILIFLLMFAIASLFAVFLGDFAFVLFHGVDAKRDAGLVMLYGYISIIIMILIVFCSYLVCWPNVGRKRVKGFK